jgi:hypothetical protein
VYLEYHLHSEFMWSGGARGPRGAQEVGKEGAQEVRQDGAQEGRGSCGWCLRRKKNNPKGAWVGRGRVLLSPSGHSGSGTEGQKKVQLVFY